MSDFASMQRSTGYEVPLPPSTGADDTMEKREARRARDQEVINTGALSSPVRRAQEERSIADWLSPSAHPAIELTEEEDKEVEELETQGFGSWSKRQFQQFVNSSAKYGRHAYQQMTADVEGKTLDEIKEYGTVFWARYSELPGPSLLHLSIFTSSFCPRSDGARNVCV